jgi:cytochrome c oxidase accessory protein FixG
MGIDIRNGQQLECITCALCIDACDEVMGKVGLPRGLISYDTLSNMERRARGEKTLVRLVRPRTLFYVAIIVVVGAVMLATLLTRPTLSLNVLRDRNPLYVLLSDGDIRNGYTLKLINKHHETRHFRLSVQGLKDARIAVVGLADEAAPLEVPSDSLRSFRVFVSAPRSAFGPHRDDSVNFRFVVTDTADGNAVRDETSFRGPER